MKKLLIDGDILLYNVTFQSEERTHYGGGFWLWSGNEQVARDALKFEVGRLLADTGCTELEVIFSCPSHHYFRHELYPAYKSGRTKNRKPLLFPALRAWCCEEWGCGRYEAGLEADDLLGLLSGPNTVISSIDKDMLTLVGWVYNPDTGLMIEIDEEQADWNFHIQCLTGDATDGYPGCPKVGPKAAAGILNPEGADAEARLEAVVKTSQRIWGGKKADWMERWAELEKLSPWKRIVMAYESAGLTADEALQQARMARILRPGEYDFETHSPRLFTPLDNLG